MPSVNRREHKVLAAVATGALVWAASSFANLVLMPIDRTSLTRQLVANFIGGLMGVIAALVLCLRHEEVHYQLAIERAAVIAELNHHIRNAVFPLRIAVQSLGNAEANKIADEAMERVNIALKDATTDALARRVNYAAPEYPAVQ
jgi:hypothetical protein